MRLLTFLILFPILAFSQDSLSVKLWIAFEDKGSHLVSDFSPSDLFSQRAIDRREKQNIPLHYSDLPIPTSYLLTLQDLGFTILNKSKWFNGVTALYSGNNADALLALDFVKQVDTLQIFFDLLGGRQSSKFDDIVFENDYGDARNQIEMIEGVSLHEQGYQGQGMHIAVLDAGFRNTDWIDAFEHLFANNQILGTWDYVDGESSVYEDNYHGMSVLSVMGGYIQDEFRGTAPKASYWLLRTEDAGSETLIEEYNWAVAAEFADSVGVDIINSSLGYTTFDIESQNHTYADLDGKTTVITRAATMASRKGMIVCNSAGNSGNNPWYYIGAPADADSILSVGSVYGDRQVSSFSSYGPSSDGRVKPSVSAQGGNTSVITSSNAISTSNGTSFSSPIIAGMTACLWQSHYDKSNMQIIDAIIQSAHLYQNPDEQLGYGIPNYALANALLLGVEDVEEVALDIYPNPVQSNAVAYLYTANNTDISYRLIDMQGRVIMEDNIAWSYTMMPIEIPSLQSGIYLLEATVENEVRVERLNIVD